MSRIAVMQLLASGVLIGSANTAFALDVPRGSGPIRNATFLTFPLTDRLELKINVGSGNLLIRGSELNLPGVTGNVTLGSAYNSLLIGTSVATGALGNGWHATFGVDLKLFPAADGTVTYVGAGGLVGVFRPNGAGGFSTPAELRSTLTRDGAGWKIVEHGSGMTLFFTGAGQLDRTTDRNGNVVDVAYDGAGRQTQITANRGSPTVRIARTTYGANGFIATLTQSGDDGTSRTISYGYDAAGNLVSITGPTGARVSFGYDGAHRLTSISVPTTETPATTTIAYDGQNRVTSLTRQIGPKSTDLSTVRLSYVSSTQTQVASPTTDQSQPVGSVPHTTYTLDADKRVTQSTDPVGNTRSTTYTPLGDVATTTSAEGGTTSNTYGANGGESLTQSVSATGALISFAYASPASPTNSTANFQQSSGIDGQGNASLYSYNGAGNRTSTTDAVAAKASVDYNDDGSVKSATDPANGTNATTYSYDGNKQLTAITPPTGNSLGVRRFTYDAYARLRTSDDGAGRVTTFGYDAADRVIAIAFSDGTPSVTYTFDGSGRMVKRIDGSGITTYTYDKAGRLLTRGNTAGGKTLTYQYDAADNLTALSDGRGTMKYTYDTRNLLTSAVNSDATLYTFNYDKDGRRTHTFFNTVTGNATWTTRTVATYDKSGRLTRLTTARNSNPNAVVYDTSFCYAAFVAGQPCNTATTADSGLKRWSRDERTGIVSLYSYDGGNRLTRATNVAGHTYEYAYDANGNRRSVTVDGVTTQSLSFNSANQITSAGYSYDAAGNLLAARTPATAEYAYNAAGQTTRSTSGGIETPRVYAGIGQFEETSIGETDDIHITYGRQDQYGAPWLQSYDHDAAVVYIERDGYGTPLGMRTGAVDHTFVLDGQGSVVAIVKKDGTIAASYTYDPYGAPVTASEPGLGQPNVVRYAGGVYDEATGLTRFGNRWYDPSSGRFTQQDNLNRIGDPGRGNRYAYAGDDPVNNVDPLGLWSVDAGVKLCYVLCVLGGIAGDDETGDHPYLGFGLGSPGESGGLMFSKSDVSEGWTAELGCSAGYGGASYSKTEDQPWSLDNFSAGVATYESSGTCDLSAKYVFPSL